MMRILSVAMVFFLAGCVMAAPLANTPDMTFDNVGAVNVNVAKVEVRDDYQPPMQDPNVEHLFPMPPYAAAEKMLKKELVATGSSMALRAIIEDASVVREELPVNKSFTDYFMREPSVRLHAKVRVRFEMFSPKAPDIVLGHAEVLAKRTKTLLEGTSVADRDRAYFTLTEDLMDDLSDGLKPVIRAQFGGSYR